MSASPAARYAHVITKYVHENIESSPYLFPAQARKDREGALTARKKKELAVLG